MNKLEKKAICAATSFVKLLIDKGYRLEIIYDPNAGTNIYCKKFSGDMDKGFNVEGSISLAGAHYEIKGPNDSFVKYVKERLK